MSDGTVNTSAVNVARLYRVTDGATVVLAGEPDLAAAERGAERYAKTIEAIVGPTDIVITEYAEAAAVGLLMQRLEEDLWTIAEHAVAVGVPPAISSLPTVAAAMRIIRAQGLEAYRAEKAEAGRG